MLPKKLIRRLKEKLLGGRQNLAKFTLMPTQQGFAFACECNRFVQRTARTPFRTASRL
jgi:hypothetical protein